MAILIDSNSETNWDNDVVLNPDYPVEAQSFTANNMRLDSVKFYLAKTLSPTGNLVARIYAHSGTYGTSSIPTGGVLASSEAYDASLLTSSSQLITFNFVGANRITLSNQYYIVAIAFDGGDELNFINVGADLVSPQHSGSWSRFTFDTWTVGEPEGGDLCFYVYGSSRFNPVPSHYRT